MQQTQKKVNPLIKAKIISAVPQYSFSAKYIALNCVRNRYTRTPSKSFLAQYNTAISTLNLIPYKNRLGRPHTSTYNIMNSFFFLPGCCGS